MPTADCAIDPTGDAVGDKFFPTVVSQVNEPILISVANQRVSADQYLHHLSS